MFNNQTSREYQEERKNKSETENNGEKKNRNITWRQFAGQININKRQQTGHKRRMRE